MTSASVDPLKLLTGVAALLLAFGVIPFTPGVVGVLIFLSMCNFEFTWSAVR